MSNESEGSKAQVNNQATIKSGVYVRTGNYVGRTISDIRSELGPQWSIPNDAAAFRGKEQMNEDYVVQPGDSLEFVKRLGEKGV